MKAHLIVESPSIILESAELCHPILPLLLEYLVELVIKEPIVKVNLYRPRHRPIPIHILFSHIPQKHYLLGELLDNHLVEVQVHQSLQL